MKNKYLATLILAIENKLDILPIDCEVLDYDEFMSVIHVHIVSMVKELEELIAIKENEDEQKIKRSL